MSGPSVRSGRTSRRALLSCISLACAVALGASSVVTRAQSPWPSKPIRIVVPFPAGGQLDIVARLVGDRLSAALGQPVLVDPRPGADGNIGTEIGAKAAPDGYTWVAVSPPTTIQPSVRPKTLKYDPIRDFEPVAFIGTSPFLFVVPASLGVNSLDEFVSQARAQPGKWSYAGSARGTVVHLATELFMHDAGVRMEMISYPGQPSAIADLITGRVQFMTLGLILAEPQIKGGKLKALAILDQKRYPKLPDVPTVVEKGLPSLTMTTWFGFAMPKDTPAAIVERVNAETMKVMQSPDIVQKLNDMGIDVAKPNTPQEFGKFLRDDVERWKKVVRDARIETE